ncbi:DUF3667 domain-containing protein [Maribellus sediminis]|uniref:DUF3667 domain-containing protein n=1 Tax=Maribellus sediminis TaxID=2696285 RepID=UPI00142FF6BF|nr:DUF3667 domain-containing protein [Maribellus sediminis]
MAIKRTEIHMWSKLKERIQQKRTKAPAGDHCCKNCETEFTGHYCPNCGQAVKEFDKPFSFIFYNFLGDFFAFDTRFFKTLFLLIAKPGFLTKQYFDGKRVRYAPPFRIYIFVSFILFLLLQNFTNRGLTTVLDSELDGDKIGLDSASMVVADSILSTVNQDMDPEQKAVVDSLVAPFVVKDTTGEEGQNFKLDMETFRETRNLRQALNKYAISLEEDLEVETDPEKRTELREYIRYCRSPETALAKILQYISWAFFLLLPLFAVLLKLVYIRRRQNYMRHLVFSIHIHSFVLLVMIAIMALFMSFGTKVTLISTILFLSVPLYFIIAMKKFYGQSVGKAIMKFFAVSFMYNIVFWIIVIYASLNAINLV